MNLVLKAMMREASIPDETAEKDIFPKQSWRQFRKCCINKKLILAGSGAACEEFLLRYGTRYQAEYIVDNAEERDGHTLKEFKKTDESGRYGELKIYSVTSLTEHEKENSVFLITPIVPFSQLMQQFYAMGCRNVFSYFLMEKKTITLRILYHTKKIRTAAARVWKKYDWDKIFLFYRNRKYPVKKNKIFFTSFNGTGYCDHGRYITEKLIAEGVDCEIVWALEDAETAVPPEVRIVRMADLPEYIYELSTSGIWINNCDFAAYVRKRRGQIYIQTKHWTGITLKKFYLDADAISRNRQAKQRWIHNGKMMDYIITGSQFDSEACARGFRPKGKCLALGSARMDILFRPENKVETVKAFYGIDKDCHILLYAPTYRFRWEENKYQYIVGEYELDYDALTACLESRFGGQWRILLRLHPGVRKYAAQVQGNGHVIDASSYPAVQELLAACDILLSDYSSIMFEPAYVKKPVFLFAPDLEIYLQNDYEFLIDYDRLPFPLARNNSQLIHQLEIFDMKEYEIGLNRFLSSFDLKEDGHACERIVALLKTIISV